MFTPINRLPGQDKNERLQLHDRWDSDEGRRKTDHILTLIRGGAGEDFLQSDFESGRLPMLENKWDLRGFEIWHETFKFPDGDTFEAIDFSYGAFWETTFENAVFESKMEFGRVSGCTFTRCIFIDCHFFAVRFQDSRFIDCDFIEACGFTNCDFNNTIFQGCHIRVPIFVDCRLDVACKIDTLAGRSNRPCGGKLDPKLKADLYLGISDAFKAGRVGGASRKFLFSSLQEATRHNAKGISRLTGYIKECLFGYGLLPLRVLITLAGFFGVGTTLFAMAVPVRDAIILAAGALFTFGVHADKLDSLASGYSVLYVFLAFAGISLTALFAAVSARVFLSED